MKLEEVYDVIIVGGGHAHFKSSGKMPLILV